MRSVIVAICLVTPCTAAWAAVDDSAAASAVGCYEADGRELLVTWGPEGGLAVADLRAATVRRFESTATQPDLWTEKEKPATSAAAARFSGLGTDSAALSWRGPDSEGETAFSRVGCGYRQEEIVFASAGVELAALLLLPDSPGPTPGVAFIHGSGDSDRVGASYLRTADYLASRGVAVLVPDKRGVGRSGGDWRRASLQDLAADAQAATRALASRPSVADGRVGVLAVSQGGWVAPEAARDSSPIDFVVVLSGAAVSFADQQRHVLENVARRMELSTGDIERLLRLFRLGERYLLDGEGWDAYAAARMEALAGSLAPVAGSLPASPAAWEWSWGRSFWTFDPVDAWKQTTVPVLMVFGEEDERDSIPVRDSLDLLQETISPGREEPFEAHVFPGMGHALTESGERHLSSSVLRLLVTWIEEQTMREGHLYSFACGRSDSR